MRASLTDLGIGFNACGVNVLTSESPPKVRTPPRNRAWRKLHLAVDAKSGQIVASELTHHRTYDWKSVYEAAQRKGHGQAVRVLIPPTHNAWLKSAPSRAMKERNRNVLSIRELGRRKWHKQSAYSQRSMVENAIYRYKTILGGHMRSRGLKRQRIEVQIACKILNRMALFGMPDSCKVA